MNRVTVLNYSPLLLTNIPFQDSNLAIAVNQIEGKGQIAFRCTYQIDNVGSGGIELEVQNKKEYENGAAPIWGLWDKELYEINKILVNAIGNRIETFFKQLI